MSPGFGGLCAVVGAAIAYAAATLSTRQKSRADAEFRRQAELGRAWDRFVWLVEHRNELEKALILGLLQRISATAAASNDAVLAEFCLQVSDQLLRAVEQLDVAPWTETMTRPDNRTDEGGM